MSRKYPTVDSFKFAFSGISTAIRQEPNFRVHILFSILAISLGLILGLSYLEWIILTLTITFVLIMELVNTSLESLVNIVSPEIKEGARVAKDVAAAAVLISAIASVVIGVLLFLPKILQIIL